MHKPFYPLRNLRLTIAESALTHSLICMSIMTPFYQFIGLSHAKIALSQIIFTVVMLILEVPTGWIADRFSRKWANAIGDLVHGSVFIFYANATSFAEVVLCEIMLGISGSLSHGVDQSLLRHFSKQIDPSEEFFRQQTARLQICHYASMIFLVGLGGPLGALDYRLAIRITGVPYLIAGCLSLLITDDGEHLVTNQAVLRDMIRIIKNSLRNRPLRLRIFAYAIGREVTHASIFVFTPLLILAGVPLSIVSLGWIFNAILALLGGFLAKQYSAKLKDWQVLTIPLLLVCISMSILTCRLDLMTIWCYGLMGIVQGWTGSTLISRIQQHVPAAEQTTTISFANILGRLIYIPTSGLVGLIADQNLRLVPVAVMLLFLPIGFVLALRLRK